MSEKVCEECELSFNPEGADSSEICNTCRKHMAPCLDCGANDDYQAGEMCERNDPENSKNDCHGAILWG